jgi:hypothetical protein
MKVRAGGEILGSEAGAGVVDFQKFDGPAAPVADRCSNVMGMAAGYCDEGGEEREGGDRTHESQDYQAGGEGCPEASRG